MEEALILTEDDGKSDIFEVKAALKKMIEIQKSRSELRKLRNKIYARIYSCQSVLRHLEKYHSLTEHFIVKFEDKLSVEDIASLESRVQITANAAKMFNPHKKFNLEISKPYNFDPKPDGASNSDMDKEILRRLTRLQCFSKARASDRDNFNADKDSSDLPTKCVTQDIVLASTMKIEDKVMASISETLDKAPISWTRNSIMAATNGEAQNIMKASIRESQNIMKASIRKSRNLTMQTLNTIIANSTSNKVTFDTDKQQELLDLITNLCYMQTSVVTMVIRATIILDKLNMFAKFLNTSKYNSTIQLEQAESVRSGLPPPQSEHVLPVGSLANGVQKVISLSPLNCCWHVVPWKRKGIIYSKLY